LQVQTGQEQEQPEHRAACKTQVECLVIEYSFCFWSALQLLVYTTALMKKLPQSNQVRNNQYRDIEI
jgi:hypothetical protein